MLAAIINQLWGGVRSEKLTERSVKKRIFKKEARLGWSGRRRSAEKMGKGRK